MLKSFQHIKSQLIKNKMGCLKVHPLAEPSVRRYFLLWYAAEGRQLLLIFHSNLFLYNQIEGLLIIYEPSLQVLSHISGRGSVSWRQCVFCSASAMYMYVLGECTNNWGPFSQATFGNDNEKPSWMTFLLDRKIFNKSPTKFSGKIQRFGTAKDQKNL